MITDIAPEEAWGYSLEPAKVIYRHFCEILTRRYGKAKQRSSKKERYRSTFVTPLGVGVKVGGNDALVSCIVESPEEMFIASEYARLVAKGYISEDEESRLAVAGLNRGRAHGLVHVKQSRSPAQCRRR